MEKQTRERFLSMMLRGIRDDLMEYAMPALTSGDAKEHIQFAHLTLDRYCADMDTGCDTPASMLEDYVELIAEAGRLTDAQTIDSAHVADLQEMRARISNSLAQLADFEFPDEATALSGGRWLQKVVALESRLRAMRESAKEANRYHARGGRPLGSSPEMSLQTLSAYLLKRMPRLPMEPVTSFRVLPGGRSKQTIFVALKPNDELPCELVIRQDIAGGAVDTSNGTTSVVHEYPVLAALAGRTVPIARALFLENNATECGAPFMVVERIKGGAPGNFMGFFEPQDPATRSTVEDLARVLARLHCIDLHELGLTDELSKKPEERLRQEIDYRMHKWRRDSVEPSPIMECALARLRGECRPGLGGPALVHGDAMAHNLLVADGRITALVDWEFVHVGDPAQDLAYCRKAVEQVMPWEAFMTIYVDSGGAPISEKRLAIFGLVASVRNCTFSATFARRFLNGSGADLTGAEAGYFSIPMLEGQMLELLDTLGPL